MRLIDHVTGQADYRTGRNRPERAGVQIGVERIGDPSTSVPVRRAISIETLSSFSDIFLRAA